MDRVNLKALIMLSNNLNIYAIRKQIVKETIKLMYADMNKSSISDNEKTLIKKYIDLLSLSQELPLGKCLDDKIDIIITMYVFRNYSINDVNNLLNDADQEKVGDKNFNRFCSLVKFYCSYPALLNKTQDTIKRLSIEIEEINERMIGVKGVDITAQKGTSSKSKGEVMANLISKKDMLENEIKVNEQYIKQLKKSKMFCSKVMEVLDMQSRKYIDTPHELEETAINKYKIAEIYKTNKKAINNALNIK